PGKRLYAYSQQLETDNVKLVSLLCGFPAADFPDCGPSLIAYGTHQEDADNAAEKMYQAFMAAESDFDGTTYSAEEGVAEAMRIAQQASRPVIIADAQDNPGAGGDSNTTGILRAL